MSASVTTSNPFNKGPMPDQPTDNALYLRRWAADIRESSGTSVDADRLDAIASEIERLRAEREKYRDAWVGAISKLATNEILGES